MASLASTIKEYVHWFHFGTFVHEPLKESLLKVFHKVLPRNPKDLYRELDNNHKVTLTMLQRNGVLKQDQMLLIFPKNKQETYSSTFDVTLLAVLIRNCCKLPFPVNGWNDKDPPPSDQSIAANVIRARELRNFFHHADPKEFDEKILDEKWLEGDAVVSALGHNYDSQALKTAPLDSASLPVVHSLILCVQNEQDASKKHASKFEADTKKQLQDEKTSMKDLTDKIENNEKLLKILVDTCKRKENLEQQKLLLYGIHSLFSFKPTQGHTILKM